MLLGYASPWLLSLVFRTFSVFFPSGYLARRFFAEFLTQHRRRETRYRAKGGWQFSMAKRRKEMHDNGSFTPVHLFSSSLFFLFSLSPTHLLFQHTLQTIAYASTKKNKNKYDEHYSPTWMWWTVGKWLRQYVYVLCIHALTFRIKILIIHPSMYNGVRYMSYVRTNCTQKLIKLRKIAAGNIITLIVPCNYRFRRK